MENKYALKLVGASAELRAADGKFVYFSKDELQRASPLLMSPPEQGEPVLKQPRLDSQTAPGIGPAAPSVQSPLAQNLGPNRLEGRVKWWSKERGYGKIEPIVQKGQQPAEQVFVHKNGMDGGPESLHAQAIDEGIIVTYEVIMREGKPCATSVQVGGIAPAISYAELGRRDTSQDAMITQLIATGLQIGTHQITGHHKSASEDRFLTRVGVPVQNLGDYCKNQVVSVFGVFDGHSGASCSDFVAVNLDKTIFDCIRHRGRENSGKSLTSDVAFKSAVLAAFRTTEHNFFQYANKLEGGAAHAWATAGSTATCVCLYGPDEEGRLKLVTANAGDSRSVLGRSDGTAIRLSQDHTPDLPGERKRIEQEGSSVVNAQGIWRIVLPNWRRGSGVAGLSVSRGFGDLEYKQAAKVVSAVPDVFLRNVDLEEDSFVILGSDGIWGPVSDEEAVRIVCMTLREGGPEPHRVAAQQIAELAHAREPHDDKTCVVVWFGNLPELPSEVMNSAAHHLATSRMKPRHVAAADDMFTASIPAGPKADLSELDDLFAAFASEMSA
jgi:serine/threonine protein phosphatase PrpC/cold shock CspA family protein